MHKPVIIFEGVAVACNWNCVEVFRLQGTIMVFLDHLVGRNLRNYLDLTGVCDKWWVLFMWYMGLWYTLLTNQLFSTVSQCVLTGAIATRLFLCWCEVLGPHVCSGGNMPENINSVVFFCLLKELLTIMQCFFLLWFFHDVIFLLLFFMPMLLLW